MAERADGRDASTAADYFPLARAAAIAHERLFPEQPTKDAKTLDVIALALSTLIPIYQSEDGGAPHALGEAELAAGRFTRGGTRLEVPGRAPIRFLMVSRSDLNDALEKLAQDALTAARVSLTLRQSPRHPKPL